VFSSNIKRGSDFLIKNSGIFILVFSINCQWTENFGKYFANKSDLIKDFRGQAGGNEGYV
jgi:hypothetical protein